MKKFLKNILFSKKINENTGLVKYRIFGIVYKKKYDAKYATIVPFENKYNICGTIHVLKNFYDYILNLCKQDEYNLILHRHLGDSYAILCLKDAFEKQYNKKLHFLIRPRQEVLMKLFNIENYSIYNPNDVLKIKDYVAIDNICETKRADKIEEDIYEKLFSSIPVLSFPFICAPIDFVKERHGYKNFLHGWATMLGLDVEKAKPKICELEITENITKTLGEIDFDKTICFAPEANSCGYICREFWEILAQKLNEKGYHIITNAVNKSNSIKGTRLLEDLPLVDFIAFAKNCKAFFSIRSGLADVVCALQKNSFVFSSEEIYKDYFYMNKCYELPHKVYEIRIESNIRKKEAIKLANNLINILEKERN